MLNRDRFDGLEPTPERFAFGLFPGPSIAFNSILFNAFTVNSICISDKSDRKRL